MKGSVLHCRAPEAWASRFRFLAGSRFCGDLAARRGWGGWGVSEAVEGFCDHPSGWLSPLVVSSVQPERVVGYLSTLLDFNGHATVPYDDPDAFFGAINVGV